MFWRARANSGALCSVEGSPSSSFLLKPTHSWMHFISICVSATPAGFKWVTQQLWVGQSRKPKVQRSNYCGWQLKENCLLMIPSWELSSESWWCQNTTSSYSSIVLWIGVKLFCFVIKWSLIGKPIHKRRWSLRAIKLLGPLKSELWTEARVQPGLSFFWQLQLQRKDE